MSRELRLSTLLSFLVSSYPAGQQMNLVQQCGLDPFALAAVAPGASQECFTSGGVLRCFWKYQSTTSLARRLPPRPHNANFKRPLVIDMHDHGGCAEQMVGYSGWKELADQNSAIVIWPQGLEVPDPTTGMRYAPSWNAGSGSRGCCGGAVVGFVDDVGFIRALIERVAAADPMVDRDRVYMAGHGNGCAMAQRMAAEASDIVAAVGCHSMYLLVEPPANFVPVPVLEIHGMTDAHVSFASCDRWAGSHLLLPCACLLFVPCHLR